MFSASPIAEKPPVLNVPSRHGEQNSPSQNDPEPHLQSEADEEPSFQMYEPKGQSTHTSKLMPLATGVDSEKVLMAHGVQAAPFQYRPVLHRQASGVSDPAELVEDSRQARQTLASLPPEAVGV